MAVQYAGGTNVNTTFTNTTGTRREIVDGLVAALTTAGWTVDSGSGTGDVHMKSAITPQGCQAIVRIYDPGSGSCARLQLKNVAKTLSSSDNVYLYPMTGRVWRVIACKYQFIIFVPGTRETRSMAFMSVPYVFPFLTSYITNTAFLIGNSKYDTDTSTGGFLRDIMIGYHNNYNWQQNSTYLVNNTMFECANRTDGSGTGLATMLVYIQWYAGNQNVWTYGTYRFTDGTLFGSDPIIAYGTTTMYEEATIKGQLWDMVIINESLPGDITIPYDGRTFWNLTFNNTTTRNSAFIYAP